MSEFLPLKGFAQQGLNTDVIPWDLPEGFLTDMQNIRVINNKLVTFGGYRTWSTAPVDFGAGWLIHGGALNHDFWLVAGATGVFSFGGNTWTDISGAFTGGPVDESLWTGDVFSEFIVLTHPNEYPFYWAGTNAGDPLVELPWSPTQTWADVDVRAGIIRSHKDFLIAMDLNEQGTELLDVIRWSDIAIDGLPASWDETDPATLAGRIQLGGRGGRIIDGRSLRDAFCVYREDGISVMDYTGDFFVWRIRHLENTSGAITKDAIVEVKGVHYFIGDGDIFRNDGNEVRSIMHKRIRTRFLGNINVAAFDKSYAIRHELAKEIWFCVPEKNSEYPNTAYVYNYVDDTWFVRELNPEFKFMAYGPQSEVARRTWDSWTETWNTATGVWGQSTRTPLNNTLVGISAGSTLLLPDSDEQDNVEVYNCFIERTDLAIEGHANVTTIKSIYPHMRSTIPVQIRIGSQDRAGSPIRWKPFQTFDPQVDRKVDIRTTGELHCFRIEAPNNDGFWEFSGMDVEYDFAGKR